MSCIEHTQGGTAAVYGTVQYEGKTVLRHRLAYVQHHGLTLADIHGKVVRHTCDNPRCYNHEHLLLGSHSDNMKDMWERGRGTNLPPVITGRITHKQSYRTATYIRCASCTLAALNERSYRCCSM